MNFKYFLQKMLYSAVFTIIFILIAIFFLNRDDKSDTYGMYKYDDERLIHFENFMDNEAPCEDTARYLSKKYANNYYCKKEK